MSRSRTDPEVINQVIALVAKGNTVEAACQTVGIAPATYYRHKAAQPVVAATIDRKTVHERLPSLRDRLTKHCWTNATEAPPEPDALLRRIAQATSTIFGGQPPPRRRTQDPALDDLIDALLKVEASLPRLSHQADGLVEGTCEPDGPKASLKDLLERAVAMLPELSARRDALLEHARATGDAAGGPNTDPRVGALTTVLADIYADQTGQRPTYSEDPESGVPTSAYGFLVENTFQTLLHDIVEHEHAWRDAAKFAARRFDYAPD